MFLWRRRPKKKTAVADDPVALINATLASIETGPYDYFSWNECVAGHMFHAAYGTDPVVNKYSSKMIQDGLNRLPAVQALRPILIERLSGARLLYESDTTARLISFSASGGEHRAVAMLEDVRDELKADISYEQPHLVA